MFSTELSYALEAAYREASNRKHTFFCVEHILFALLFESEQFHLLFHKHKSDSEYSYRVNILLPED